MVDRQVRPVSGEIMTVERDAASPRAAETDVVDAEFEIVAGARPARPQSDPPGHRFTVAVERQVAGMDILRGGAEGAAPVPGRRGGFAFWSFGVALAIAAFWISGGHTLAGPLLAAFASKPAALKIAELTSRVENHGGRSLLIIDGTVVNHGCTSDALPPLLIEVTGDAGRVTRYTLDSAGAGIGPGAQVRFSSRVDAPIGGVAGVSVKMSERSD